MSEERFYLHELAGMVAARVLTAENPAAALAKFEDDLAGELAAGRVNLEGSEALREAFREAMGYSRRVPDALGEQEPTGREAGASSSPVAGSGGATPAGSGGATPASRSHNDSRGTLGANPASCSPSALSGDGMTETADCFLHGAFDAALRRCPKCGAGRGSDTTGAGARNTRPTSLDALSGRDSTLPATQGAPPVAPGHTGPSRPPNALRLVRGDS